MATVGVIEAIEQAVREGVTSVTVGSETWMQRLGPEDRSLVTINGCTFAKVTISDDMVIVPRQAANRTGCLSAVTS
jgi:hypothetical protein